MHLIALCSGRKARRPRRRSARGRARVELETTSKYLIDNQHCKDASYFPGPISRALFSSTRPGAPATTRVHLLRHASGVRNARVHISSRRAVLKNLFFPTGPPGRLAVEIVFRGFDPRTALSGRRSVCYTQMRAGGRPGVGCGSCRPGKPPRVRMALIRTQVRKPDPASLISSRLSPTSWRHPTCPTDTGVLKRSRAMTAAAPADPAPSHNTHTHTLSTRSRGPFSVPFSQTFLFLHRIPVNFSHAAANTHFARHDCCLPPLPLLFPGPSAPSAPPPPLSPRVQEANNTPRWCSACCWTFMAPVS